jgi:hypothetical protein
LALADEKQKAKARTACELPFLGFFRKLGKKEKIRVILLILSE